MAPCAVAGVVTHAATVASLLRSSLAPEQQPSAARALLEPLQHGLTAARQRDERGMVGPQILRQVREFVVCPDGQRRLHPRVIDEGRVLDSAIDTRLSHRVRDARRALIAGLQALNVDRLHSRPPSEQLVRVAIGQQDSVTTIIVAARCLPDGWACAAQWSRWLAEPHWSDALNIHSNEPGQCS